MPSRETLSLKTTRPPRGFVRRMGLVLGLLLCPFSHAGGAAAEVPPAAPRGIWGTDFTSTSPDWLGQTTVFTNISADPAPGAPYTAFTWAFGDGTTSTERDPVHTYAAPGTYTVALRGTTALGGEDVTAHAVTVFGPPQPGFFSTSPDSCGTPSSFTNTTTTVPDGDPALGMLWAFGDGATSTDVHPVHTYAAPGTYTVTLTATNPAASVAATGTVVIVAGPAPDLRIVSTAPDKLGETTVLTAAVSGGTPTTATWDFGDGAAGTGLVTAHTYPAPGTYTARVTTTVDALALTAAAPVTITTDAPIAGLHAANSSPTRLGAATTFTATLTAGDLVAITWDFGDGSTGTGPVTAHTYAAEGTYTARVTATNSAGTASATTTAVVDGTPPPAPVLVSPPDGTVLTRTLTLLTWQPGPALDIAGYRLRWQTTTRDVGARTQIGPPTAGNGTYTWTVAAYDTAGNLGPYAAPWTLIVQTAPAPGTVYLPLIVRPAGP